MGARRARAQRIGTEHEAFVIKYDRRQCAMDTSVRHDEGGEANAVAADASGVYVAASWVLRLTADPGP
jgi:hypothetical protein